jgi:hypothetical protein
MIQECLADNLSVSNTQYEAWLSTGCFIYGRPEINNYKSYNNVYENGTWQQCVLATLISCLPSRYAPFPSVSNSVCHAEHVVSCRPVSPGGGNQFMKFTVEGLSWKWHRFSVGQEIPSFYVIQKCPSGLPRTPHWTLSSSS